MQREDGSRKDRIGTIILRTIKKAIPAGYSLPRMDVGIFCLNSKMQTGWVSWNGKWYFLNSDGAMAEKQYVGNFYLGEDGAALISAETPDQRKTSENGSLLRKGKPMQELNEKTAKIHLRFDGASGRQGFL